MINTNTSSYTIDEITKSGAKLVAISRGSYVEVKRYFKHYCYLSVGSSRFETAISRKYVLVETYYEIPWFNILSILISLLIIILMYNV